MTSVQVAVTSKFTKGGYSSRETRDVESFMVDSAMDTDTDSWSLSVGDPELALTDLLRRDSEVRVNIYSLHKNRVNNLHTGFADEITLDENNVVSMTGRDITAVAVDSQRPPGNFKLTRPEVFVARDARALKIGDRLRLTKAPPFKKFAVDGSQSYWETWYRLYRKRRMWIWAEPDASIVAGTLNYNARPSYYLGGGGAGWIPVERLEIRSNKQQRVWEVYVIGNRGDVSFVSNARDATIREWIKRRQVFVRSATAHNPAEARVEAWEEIFEGKVGAVEIRLTIADPGFIMRQNSIARVDIKQVGLKGDFFVVGSRTYGTQTEGLYQEVRLRERNYAISRRQPSDPRISGTPASAEQEGAGGVAEQLGVRWKEFFVEAANKHHGPWPYKLFLGVLLAICEQETGFRNVRGGGSIEWPGTANGKAPSIVTQTAAYNKFAATFANDPREGRTNTTYAVGPMQLYSTSYKDHADDLGGFGRDELGGGRWMPRYNIIAGAFALRDKLKGSGAEAALGGGGSADSLIWEGVADYGHLFAGETVRSPTGRYAKEVRGRYEDEYKTIVEDALAAARQSAATDTADADYEIPTGTLAELRDRVLNNKMIEFQNNSVRDDVRFGLVDPKVLKFLLAFTNAGFTAFCWVFKTGHDKYVKGSSPLRISKHWYGLAVDIGNYNIVRPAEAEAAQRWIMNNRLKHGAIQLIGPIDHLTYGATYDQSTLQGHDNHIHVGW